MKYEFGVMSNVWTLEAEDINTAYIAMAIFMEQNIPIVVYKPQTYSFMPVDILEQNKDSFDPSKVRQSINSIKKVEL